MEAFPYYYKAWLLYCLLGIAFFSFSYWTLRKMPLWFKIPLFSFAFAFAFTPCTVVKNGNEYAPAAIVAIFELEQFGKEGFWRGFTPILIVWFLLLTLSMAAYIGWHYKRKAKSEQPKPNEDDEIKIPEDF